jgi:acyl-CoA synthetase (AMP-forming)/AMP-acid ligase II
MTFPTESDAEFQQQVWSLEDIANVGMTLAETARRMPDHIAVAAPARKGQKRPPIQYATISFGELERESNRIANVIGQLGISPGTRLSLMVPPGLEFVSLVFGLFKAGIVTILIDPGMGRKNMIKCLSAAEPEGIVGIKLAQMARMLFRRKFPKSKHNIVVGANYWPGCHSLRKLTAKADEVFDSPATTRETPAAIIFTTGSTGPPKGVLYRHGNFIEQARQIRDHFQIPPGGADVSGFPLFALFNTAMGMTTVFPEMDPTCPAEVSPPIIIDAAEQFDADQSFGSPALWNTVSKHCEKSGQKLPTIRRVFTAGAPVPPHVLKRVKKCIHSDGEIYTPYGATEALPVASNSGTVVLNETAEQTNQGKGTCVGTHFDKMNWRVIEISDEPIADVSQTRELPVGEIGELIVKGSVVTTEYVTRTDANAFHKVTDGDSFWHRMGDVGYLDDQNRFWFCGRKGHRLQTALGPMFTVPCEAIVNTHPAIYRCALIGLGAVHLQIPMIVAEPWPEHWPATEDRKQRLAKEVLELCKSKPLTESVTRVEIRKALPVDIRHNSKIFREQLKTEFDALFAHEKTRSQD